MKSKKGPVIEAEIRERSEELDRLVETRTMARISNTAPAREREQGRHHGYDMITNEPWQGRNSKPIAQSRLKAPNTVWAKLHSERDAAPMGTSIKASAKPARDLSGAAAPQNPPTPSSYQVGREVMTKPELYSPSTLDSTLPGLCLNPQPSTCT